MSFAAWRKHASPVLLSQFLLLGSQWGDEMKPPYPIFRTEAYWGARLTQLLSLRNLRGHASPCSHTHHPSLRTMLMYNLQLVVRFFH
jgi:hypothetical protein